MKTENDDGEGEGEEGGEAHEGAGEADVGVTAAGATVSLLLAPAADLVPVVFDFLGGILGSQK